MGMRKELAEDADEASDTVNEYSSDNVGSIVNVNEIVWLANSNSIGLSNVTSDAALIVLTSLPSATFTS